MNWKEKKTAEKRGKKQPREGEDSSTPIVNSYSVCLKTLTKGHLESFTARTNEKHKKNWLWRMMARYNNKKINDCEQRNEEARPKKWRERRQREQY